MSVAAAGRPNTFLALLPAKGRAVGIHLSISLALFLVLLYLILVEWYPGAFFHTDGGWQGIRLMFFVDMVLGPLLTFVVFNPLKRRREIVMDLSLVALAQTSALVWGVFAVYSQRPVAMVEYQGTFHSVIAEAYSAQGIELSVLKQYDDREPAIVFYRAPQSADDVMARFMQFAEIRFYERFRDRLPQVFAHAVAFEAKITKDQPQLAEEFRRLRERHGATVDFLPFEGRYETVILALNRQGDVVDFLPMPGVTRSGDE